MSNNVILLTLKESDKSYLKNQIESQAFPKITTLINIEKLKNPTKKLEQLLEEEEILVSVYSACQFSRFELTLSLDVLKLVFKYTDRNN